MLKIINSKTQDAEVLEGRQIASYFNFTPALGSSRHNQSYNWMRIMSRKSWPERRTACGMVCVSPPTGRFEANREEVIRCLAQTMKSHSFPWAKKHVCQSADYEGLLTVWVHHANRVLVDVKSVRFSFNKFLVISKKCCQLIAPSIVREVRARN